MKTSIRLWVSALAMVTCAAMAGACGDDDNNNNEFDQTNLISDQPGVADNTDGNLQNPWGLAFGDGTFFWLANNGSGTATVCNANGEPEVGTTITVEGAPTGVVFNSTSGFAITDTTTGATAPATFIFVGEDGLVRGWSQDADPTRALLAADFSDTGAVFKGVAIDPISSQLYITDFFNRGVLVLDQNFQPVTDLSSDAFFDPDIPEKFAPFGIRQLQGLIYVTYAQQDESGTDDVAGAGLGYVDAYQPDGTLVQRIASKGDLNAPWGLAVAPGNFGNFSNTLLVGNFGNGRITAFDLNDNSEVGQLQDSNGNVLAIDGLWAIAFGNGKNAGNTDELYFTAGTGNEAHGLFGRLTPR